VIEIDEKLKGLYKNSIKTFKVKSIDLMAFVAVNQASMQSNNINPIYYPANDDIVVIYRKNNKFEIRTSWEPEPAFNVKPAPPQKYPILIYDNKFN